MPWSLTKSGHVVTVRMDSNKMNVMNHAFIDELEKTLDTLDKEYADCAVVFTGNDKAFSAGFDLNFLMSAMSGDPEKAQAVTSYVDRIDKVVWRLFTWPRPTVAALNGHAIAGGTLLAAACDFRIVDADAAAKSKMGLNEVQNGFFIPYRMQKLCSFAFNRRAAYRLFVTGALISLKEAADPAVGFVDELVPGGPTALAARAHALASSIPPTSYPAYDHTKTVEQELVRRLITEKPNQTAEQMKTMFKKIKVAKL